MILEIENFSDEELYGKLLEIKNAMKIEAIERVKKMGLQYTYKYYDTSEKVSNQKLLKNLKNVGKSNLIPKIDRELQSHHIMGVDSIKLIKENIEVIF